MTYRTIHVVRHWMPDDRLAYSTVDAEDEVVTFAYRAWHIHPLLVKGMDSISKGFADSGLFYLDPSRAGDEPTFTAWLARVPDDEMPDDQFIGYRVGPGGLWLPPSIEVLVRASLVKPEVVREMNEEVLPWATGALILAPPENVEIA